MKSLPDDNPTIAAMKFFNIPLTRQNYLEWAYGNEKPTPEIEAELPARFRLPVEEPASALEEVQKEESKKSTK